MLTAGVYTSAGYCSLSRAHHRIGGANARPSDSSDDVLQPVDRIHGDAALLVGAASCGGGGHRLEERTGAWRHFRAVHCGCRTGAQRVISSSLTSNTSCDAQASQTSKPWWSGLVQWLSVALLLSVFAPAATHHVATAVAATSDGSVAQPRAAAKKDKKPMRSGLQHVEYQMPYSVLLQLLRDAKGTAGSMIAGVEFNADKKLTVTINEEEPLGAKLAADYGVAAMQLHQQLGSSTQQHSAAAGLTLNKFSVLLPPTAVHPNVSALDIHHRRVKAHRFA